MRKSLTNGTTADAGVLATTMGDRRTFSLENRNLELGMLIVELESGRYLPVSVVSSISEAREIARGYRRAHKDDRGAFCVWAQDIDGDYNPVAKFPLD